MFVCDFRMLQLMLTRMLHTVAQSRIIVTAFHPDYLSSVVWLIVHVKATSNNVSNRNQRFQSYNRYNKKTLRTPPILTQGMPVDFCEVNLTEN